MKTTATNNLRAGYGLSLILLLLSSAASYMSIQNLLKSSKMVNHTNSLILELENSISVLKDAETGQRGFLLTGINQFLDPYNGAYDKAIKSINRVRDLSVDNPVQTKNCDELEQVITLRLKKLDQIIASKRQHGTISPNQLIEGKHYMDQARAIVKRMEDTEQKLLAARTEKMNRFATYTPLLIILAAILSLIITLVSYLRAKRDFEQRADLYNKLQEKDQDISRRINIIENVANKISDGDYKTRVIDENEKTALEVFPAL